MGIAYSLYHQLNPLDAQNIQIVKTNAVREKLSADKLQEMNALEHEITQLCVNLVNEAIDQGDITGVGNHTADSIVFGFWSMLYGRSRLQSCGDNAVEQFAAIDGRLRLAGSKHGHR